MVNAKTIISDSANRTKKFAAEIVKNITGGRVIALYGDLGSGKTTFTQGVAQALGIYDKVQSPTFVLLKQYKSNLKLKTKNEKPQLKIKSLVHVDLYRIKDIESTKEIGLVEYFNQPDSLVLIEWPEIIEKLLPKNTIKIKFEHLEEDRRSIVVVDQ